MSTGPLGSTLEEVQAMLESMTGPTGPTGTSPDNTDSTGPTGTSMYPFPTASTGTAEPPHIVTLEELMSSHSATIAKQAADTLTLQPLVAPTRDEFRPKLFQWASAGFPDLYIVQTFTITPPAICADGVTREIGKYVEYCINIDLGVALAALKELMPGIRLSWSITENTLRIHVTREV